MRTRLVAGCMTGTSLDALDAAIVEITGTGLDMRAQVIGCCTRPLGALGDTLRAVAAQEPVSARDIARILREFALLHADAIADLTREVFGATDRALDLVCAHGQTIFHDPPLSWQLFQPAPLAAALRVPVVFDLRAADLAAGGRGAPITPLADFILFRDVARTRAVLNLGGFCNWTLLPAQAAARSAPALGGSPGALLADVLADSFDSWVDAIDGGDVCACNHILDGVARATMNRAFDEDGAIAGMGSPDAEAVGTLLRLLDAQAGSRRSLGSGDELQLWVREHAQRLSPSDLARSACEAIGATVGRVLSGSWARVEEVIVAGGGSLNQTLRASIADHTGVPVVASDEFGVPVTHREAAGFAVLGALCEDRVPITLPRVTGVPRPAPIAGAWVHPFVG